MNEHFSPIRFDNSYATLPDRFYERRKPTPVSAPALIRVNRALAAELGIDAGWLESAEGVETLAGNRVPQAADPIAQAYAGHQFGQFVPQLGDGRAILLGEVVDTKGRRRDIQLKGSGRTAYSRGGDGRAAVGPVIREYVVSEAMAALSIRTTRALAAVKTGDPVFREDVLPGAVLTRVASSHIRIGTFQFFAARGDTDALRLLADHVIDRHYPAARQEPEPYRALLRMVCEAQAALVSSWMMVGFIHGVMNTDNMSIAGETIDYGPCAFMDAFDPATVFSSIDRGGRYAYGNQPHIAYWNLTRLAETLLPLLAGEEEKAIEIAQEVLPVFPETFDRAFRSGFNRKLGLSRQEEEDVALARDLLSLMKEQQADFTLVFRALGDELVEDGAAQRLFEGSAGFGEWLERWRRRLEREPREAKERRAAMHAVNPLYIPRNHRVEAAIQAALGDDFAPFEELLEVLARPYEEQPGKEEYALPAEPHERVLQTFCGT